MKKIYTIGIDLGGTTMTAGLVDKDLNIVDKMTWPTELPRPAENLEKSMVQLCHELAEKSDVSWDQITCVGIGTPGSVNSATGFVGYNTNFGYYNWELGKDMSQLLGCTVFVENDANAAAYGEFKAGGARGAKNAVVITLGTGIGSGIIIDGKIYAGSNYSGGEMGHTVIVKGGRACNCGRKGCWERYGAARALVEDTVAAMKSEKDTVLWEMCEGQTAQVNAKMAFDAMAEGDEVATAVIQNWIDFVACGVTDVINIFQPDVLCIGGGVSKQGEVLLAPIRAYVDKEDINRTGTQRTQIKAATLGNDAGVLGAALLGQQK